VQYIIRKAVEKNGKSEVEGLKLNWSGVKPVLLGYFLPESGDHRPATQCRLVYNAKGIHGQFLVQDCFVRCIRTGYGSEVWKDSCVEFFVEPRPGGGYFNFEFNCGGAFLINHILDPARTADGFKKFVRIPESIARQVGVVSSLPKICEPEIKVSATWTLEFFIPFMLLEQYVGPLGIVAGQIWHGNFYKCAEENSHPHWAAWSPVDGFNFHQPERFGKLVFAR
jgi:hypothetical protein